MVLHHRVSTQLYICHESAQIPLDHKEWSDGKEEMENIGKAVGNMEDRTARQREVVPVQAYQALLSTGVGVALPQETANNSHKCRQLANRACSVNTAGRIIT